MPALRQKKKLRNWLKIDVAKSKQLTDCCDAKQLTIYIAHSFVENSQIFSRIRKFRNVE